MPLLVTLLLLTVLDDEDDYSYLCLQDGSTLLFGSERFFQHLDMLLAVRVLVVERLQLGLQGQQLRLLLRQLLLQLVDLQARRAVIKGAFVCERL